MTHYYLSNETGTILARETDESKARETAKALVKEFVPFPGTGSSIALHAVITAKPAPVGGSVSMVGVMEWFK